MDLFPHFHNHVILCVFYLLLLSSLPSSFSLLSRGQNLPHMTSDVKEVAGKSFDYIVVGGGTAGCPLAATLSERYSVLLIERGEIHLYMKRRITVWRSSRWMSFRRWLKVSCQEMEFQTIEVGCLEAQILLLSGIGPEEHLNDFTIPVVMDLKGVGRQMKDNPCIGMLFDTHPKYRLTDPPQVVGIAKDMKYIIQGGILLVSHDTTMTLIAIKLAFPESEGKLLLENVDPRKNPSVEFNYLSKEKDLEECVKMTQLLNQALNSTSVTSFLETTPLNNFTMSPNELKDYCKKNVRTYFHYHGGCTVGSVVDSNYRVHVVNGLRVIDGSTFSESPSTNPMATVLMLGRYQGIKILREMEAKSSNLRTEKQTSQSM